MKCQIEGTGGREDRMREDAASAGTKLRETEGCARGARGLGPQISGYREERKKRHRVTET